MKHGMINLKMDRVNPAGWLTRIMDFPEREVNGRRVKVTVACGEARMETELVGLVYVWDEKTNDWAISCWVVSLSEVIRRMVSRELDREVPETEFLREIDPMNCEHCVCYRSEDRGACCFCGITHAVV